MAQYFIDFSSGTVGQTPAGWTLQEFAASEFALVADATARGGIALSVSPASNGRRTASFDAVGAVDNAEMLVRWKSSDTFYVFPAMLRQNNAVTTLTTYIAQRQSDTQKVRRYKDGVTSDITSFTDTLENTAEWAYLRFRVNGTTISIKTWSAVEAEPESWDYSGTDTAITAAGYMGIFGYYVGEMVVDSIGFGTDGDTAPDADVSGSQTATNMHINVGGVLRIVPAAYVNVGGVAKAVTAAYANVGGVPKQIF